MTTPLRVLAVLFLVLLPASCGAQPAVEPAAPAVKAGAAQDSRGGIQAALDAMAAAVLAGDPEAYLLHVWRGSPEWWTEQTNWAADLERKVPAEFEFTVGELAEGAEPGWAEAPISMKWSFTGGGGRAREVKFPARFARGESGWLYAGEKWNVLEGPGVRVLYGSGQEQAAKVVADVLPEVKAGVLAGFGLSDEPIAGRTQEVKLYKSMRHLQQSIYLGYSDPLGGWNEPGEAIKLMASGVGWKAGALVLLAHEYGHVATFELGPKSTKMPWWALEGVAELCAEEFMGGRVMSNAKVRRWARDGDLIEWHRLADFHGEAAEHYDHVYRQGHHMVAYIVDTHGRPGLNRWLAAMAGGVSLDDATREVLGFGFDELDHQWRESIGAEQKDDAPSEPEPAGR